MNTYVIDVRYYVPADEVDEFYKRLSKAEINHSGYYGGLEVVEIKENK